MWLYLRFTKLIRTREEHRNALFNEAYSLKKSKGLLGAIYKADMTDFRKFFKSYFRYQIDIYKDLMRQKKGGEPK